MSCSVTRCRHTNRRSARVGPSGGARPPLEQDRTRWDHMQIQRGLTALGRAERLGRLGTYALQAAIAACHARARTAAETNWARPAALYDALAELHPTPVVGMNRAVAVGMAFGPESGLELVDALLTEPSLRAYHLLPSVRGDLLGKLQRFSEARASSNVPRPWRTTPVTATSFSYAPLAAHERRHAKERRARDRSRHSSPRYWAVWPG